MRQQPAVGQLWRILRKEKYLKKKTRTSNTTWADSFAFIADETGLPVCLRCKEKLANNKKSNVARHFQNKHAAFTQRDLDGDERKKKKASQN